MSLGLPDPNLYPSPPKYGFFPDLRIEPPHDIEVPNKNRIIGLADPSKYPKHSSRNVDKSDYERLAPYVIGGLVVYLLMKK